MANNSNVIDKLVVNNHALLDKTPDNEVVYTVPLRTTQTPKTPDGQTDFINPNYKTKTPGNEQLFINYNKDNSLNNQQLYTNFNKDNSLKDDKLYTNVDSNNKLKNEFISNGLVCSFNS